MEEIKEMVKRILYLKQRVAVEAAKLFEQKVIALEIREMSRKGITASLLQNKIPWKCILWPNYNSWDLLIQESKIMKGSHVICPIVILVIQHPPLHSIKYLLNSPHLQGTVRYYEGQRDGGDHACAPQGPRGRDELLKIR